MPIARLAEEREKRNKYLHQKVHETLALPPPELPTHVKPYQNATYPLSVEEEKASVRQYQEKLRKNRILQVRAQEMLFASQRVEEFRDRKCKDSKKLLNYLKEVWREDQRWRIAILEEEFAMACQSIGLSHDAAVLVEHNRAAKEEMIAMQAKESRCWDTLRFEEAMHKEREHKEIKEKVESAPTVRRKIVESVSNIERTLARRYPHGSKPRMVEKFGLCQTVYPPVSHDFEQDKMFNRIAGFPIDFKDTFLHARYSVLRDCTNRPSSTVVNCPEQDEVDAWRAADARRESNRCQRAHQAKLERLYNEQKFERGNAAAAKLTNDQRIAMLEQVEEALEEEERQKDRIHAAYILCQRSSSAGQEKRPTYTKHKISYPLSCPGSIIGEDPIQKDVSPQDSVTAHIEAGPIPSQRPAVASSGKHQDQDMTEGGVEVRNAQDLEAPYDLPQQDGVQKQEHSKVESESETKNVKFCEPDNGKMNEPSQQHSFGDCPVMALEPYVSRSSHHSVVHSKIKGKSPLKAPIEHVEINARSLEGSFLKLPLVEFPSGLPALDKCLEKGHEVHIEGHMNTSEREDCVGGQVRRKKEGDKARENFIKVRDLVEKGTPVKTRIGMESVKDHALDVAKEISQYHREIRIKRAMHTHIHSSDVGENKKCQPDSKSNRPPFIYSGTQGYKKIITGPFLTRSSRPPSEVEYGIAAVSAERDSIIKSTKEDLRECASAERGLSVDNLKEEVSKSNVSLPRGKAQLSPVTCTSGCSQASKHNMETCRSRPCPARSQTGLLHPQHKGKAMKVVHGSHRGIHEDASRDQRPRHDSVHKWVGRSLDSMRRSWDINPRSKDQIYNDVSLGCFSEMLYDSLGSKDLNLKKGYHRDRQERCTQETKLVRQKAVWKSYTDEPGTLKKSSNKEKFEVPPEPAQSARSEPSSPLGRYKRHSARSRSPPASHQGDCQSEVKLEPVTKIPLVRNCHTPEASVKSLSILRTQGSSCKSHKDGQGPRKDLNVSRLGIQVEALENISTRIKSLSKRFHSPAKQVLSRTSPHRRSQTECSSKDSFSMPTLSSTQKDHARKLEEIIRFPSRSCEIVPPNRDGYTTENVGNTKKVAGSRSACNVSERLINAWKTGRFREDYSKAMRLAEEMTAEFNSSGVSIIYPERTYDKPWLSRSRSRRSPDQSIDTAKPQTNISAALGTSCKNSISPSQPLKKTSKKDRNSINISPMGQVGLSNKSPLMKSGVKSARKLPARDAWEGQSLDFVLGSLADQVRELDERLRSATASSLGLSSSPTLSSPLRRAMQTSMKPSVKVNLQDKLPEATYLNDCSSLSSSVGSSPERLHQESNQRNSSAARNVSRVASEQKQDCKDFTCMVAGRPGEGMYMDELKILLREISSENPSPSRKALQSFSVKKRQVSEARLHRDEAQESEEKRSESLYVTNQRNTRRAHLKTGFEPHFVSSTSISANSSRACSQASQRERPETRSVQVEKGRAHVDRENMGKMATQKRRLGFDISEHGYHVNSEKKAKKATKKIKIPQQVTESGHKLFNENTEKRVLERRNLPYEDTLVGRNGVQGGSEKRVLKSRWAPRQAARQSNNRIQERLEKRTVEIRGCTPHQVVHKVHTIVREGSEKKLVEGGSSPQELAATSHENDQKSSEKTSSERGWLYHEVAHDNWAPVNENLEAQSLDRVPEQGAPDGHVVLENLERRRVIRVSPQDSSNSHVVVKKSLERRMMRQMSNRPRDPPHSREGQKLRNGQPESPLWGQDRSPLSPGNWRKIGLTLDKVEEQLLLSGSVDFSPWTTERLPDVNIPKTTLEDKDCSRPSSPNAQEAGHAKWVVKNHRPKVKLNGSQNLGRISDKKQQGPQSVDLTSHPTPALFQQEYFQENANPVKSLVLERLKRPKTVPMSVDSLWALSGYDASPEICRVERSSSTGRKQERVPSVPKIDVRTKKESSSSREEMPDSTSRSSQEDNYLPVVMAKDDESRREVIERRRKARQLDMEHRQRLSMRLRPSSARSN